MDKDTYMEAQHAEDAYEEAGMLYQRTHHNAGSAALSARLLLAQVRSGFRPTEDAVVCIGYAIRDLEETLRLLGETRQAA